MTIDIHKMIIGNPISKNLMKPWGSNSKFFTWKAL